MTKGVWQGGVAMDQMSKKIMPSDSYEAKGKAVAQINCNRPAQTIIIKQIKVCRNEYL